VRLYSLIYAERYMPNAPSRKPAENTAKSCACCAFRHQAMLLRIASTTKTPTRYPVSVRLPCSPSRVWLLRHPTYRTQRHAARSAGDVERKGDDSSQTVRGDVATSVDMDVPPASSFARQHA